NLRQRSSFPGQTDRLFHEGFRQRLGMAGFKRGEPRSDYNAKSGLARFQTESKRNSNRRHRRVGTCLLSQVSESPPRIHQSVLERHQLGLRSRTLRGRLEDLLSTHRTPGKLSMFLRNWWSKLLSRLVKGRCS